MRAWVAVVSLMMSANAVACLTAFELAQFVSKESQIPAFIESTPFGGRWHRVSDSNFLIIEIQTRSGPYLRDIYVYAGDENALELRLALAGTPEVERKFEINDSVLSIYERARGAETWDLETRLLN
ncbi:MAG: hypothetical protein AAF578_04695 [Pseudomonadota bacterium]